MVTYSQLPDLMLCIRPCELLEARMQSQAKAGVAPATSDSRYTGSGEDRNEPLVSFRFGIESQMTRRPGRDVIPDDRTTVNRRPLTLAE